MYNNQNVSLTLKSSDEMIDKMFQWDSSTSGNFNASGRMYGGNQNSAANMQSQNQRWPTPGPIQRPTNNSNGYNTSSPSSQFYQQNYPNSHYQQRSMRNSANQPMASSSGMSAQQGKSQYFNQTQAGTKRELTLTFQDRQISDVFSCSS